MLIMHGFPVIRRISATHKSTRLSKDIELETLLKCSENLNMFRYKRCEYTFERRILEHTYILSKGIWCIRDLEIRNVFSYLCRKLLRCKAHCRNIVCSYLQPLVRTFQKVDSGANDVRQVNHWHTGVWS